MKRIILFGLVFFVLACTKTENGLVFGVPDFEKRDIQVSQTDLDILMKADKILSDQDVWNKNSLRECGNSKMYSLYCALEKATKEVLGKPVHRQAALQEVRFVIDDHYRNRRETHRLADFNAHKDTTFENVKFVIGKAMKAVKGKIALNVAQ